MPRQPRYSTRRTRKQWSEWAHASLESYRGNLQGLVRAYLNVTVQGGSKPSRAVWDAVERAREFQQSKDT